MSEKDQVPDSKKTMMDFSETFKHDEDWKSSRNAAEEMMRDIPRLKEEFMLDQITLGDGQCFMTAMVQQMRRPEVNSTLPPDLQKYAWIMDPRAFKFQVRKFMKNVSYKLFLFQKMFNNKTFFKGLYFYGDNTEQKHTTYPV